MIDKKLWILLENFSLIQFETYRFSEDLDFTITNPDHINPEFLNLVFSEISQWIYDESGIEIPVERLRFDIYKNPQGRTSVEGRIYYQGPLQRRGSLPRLKIDITHDEILVLNPIARRIHHPYSDMQDNGFSIQCYCFEEVFAEKLRALAERLRPRDLYDVKHNTGESRSYRIDRIQGAETTKISFKPRYTIELIPSGPIFTSPTSRKSKSLAKYKTINIL